MMTNLEAFFCQNEIYDVKTIMSDQRLEGKLFFSCRPPSVWLGRRRWRRRRRQSKKVASIWLKISKQVAYG